MKRTLLMPWLLLLAMPATGETILFTQDKPGALPAGWVAGVTGHGDEGVFQALAFQIGASHQVVEVGHVSVVVLAVVELKGLAGDMRLEGIEAVGQRGQRMSHETKDRAVGCPAKCRTAAAS